MLDVVDADPSIDEFIGQRDLEFLARLGEVGRQWSCHANSEAFVGPLLAVALESTRNEHMGSVNDDEERVRGGLDRWEIGRG